MNGVMTKEKVIQEIGATKINQMIGNTFAMPKTETHGCPTCGFEGDHIVELFLYDIDTAKKEYKCTECGELWVYTE